MYPKLTAAEKEALENTVGIELTRDIAEDWNWVYEQHYSDKAKERRNREAWEDLRAKGVTEHSTITVTPQGHFIAGNVVPLIEVLRRGEADAKLQAWLADQIEEGALAQRKSLLQRIKDLGWFHDAACDVEEIERLLKSRGKGRRGMHERAIEIAAFHFEVSLEKLKTYLKRGKKDRRRLPRIA